MKRPLVRRGRRISLGIYQRDEIPLMYSEFADSELQRFLGRADKLYYLESEYDWYDALRKDESSRVMTILLNPKGAGRSEGGQFRLIGSVGIHRIDRLSRHAELGYLLFKNYWGKGYASEAVALAVDYAFQTLNLRKLYARVFEPNKASSSVLLKNGFTLAGRLRDQVFVSGSGYADELYYELFRDQKRQARTADCDGGELSSPQSAA